MATASAPTKIVLDERDLPTHWYNIVPDLPSPPPPPLHPGTGQPLGPADLAPLFPMALIAQEVSAEPRVEIPDQVRDIYRLWRPSPLYRAHRLERALDTPAHIYYKYEGVSPAGSHKPNTAVAQAYYNKVDGVRRLTTETGAGQWGSALAFACALFGLECTVYMVRPPPEDVETELEARITARILEEQDLAGQVAEAVEELQPQLNAEAGGLEDQIRSAFDEQPAQPWSAPVGAAAQRLVEEYLGRGAAEPPEEDR